MTQLIIYSEDGSTCTGTTYDPNMISRLEGRQAMETWQVGYVGGALAIRLKTVSALNALLRQARDGDGMQIVYRPRFGSGELRETRIVRLAGSGMQPLLMAGNAVPLSDEQIVRLLGACWGEYLVVTYQLVNQTEANLEPLPASLLVASAPLAAAVR
jgi:hypothetical protein